MVGSHDLITLSEIVLETVFDHALQLGIVRAYSRAQPFEVYDIPDCADTHTHTSPRLARLT
jgi:hypothetical protein